MSFDSNRRALSPLGVTLRSDAVPTRFVRRQTFTLRRPVATEMQGLIRDLREAKSKHRQDELNQELTWRVTDMSRSFTGFTDVEMIGYYIKDREFQACYFGKFEFQCEAHLAPHMPLLAGCPGEEIMDPPEWLELTPYVAAEQGELPDYLPGSTFGRTRGLEEE